MRRDSQGSDAVEEALRSLAGALGKRTEGQSWVDTVAGFRAVLAGIPDAEIIAACQRLAADPEATWPTAGAFRAGIEAHRGGQGGPATVAQHAQAADNQEASRLLKAGVPFVFMPVTDREGKPTGDLFPMQLGKRTLEKYHRVCTRLPEWVHVPTARADAPPCLSCYQFTAIENCDERTVRECGRKVLATPSVLAVPAIAGMAQALADAKKWPD